MEKAADGKYGLPTDVVEMGPSRLVEPEWILSAHDFTSLNRPIVFKSHEGRYECPVRLKVGSMMSRGAKWARDLQQFVVEIIPVSSVGGERRVWRRRRVLPFWAGPLPPCILGAVRRA